MLEWKDNFLRVEHDDGLWRATHAKGSFGGPASVETSEGELFRGQQAYYVDDFSSETAVVSNFKAHRRAGAAEICNEAYLPFGGGLRSRWICRYTANRVRFSLDLLWPPNFPIQRHFGINTIFLPGKWHRYYFYPPALHVLHGNEPAWRDIPPMDEQTPCMIGHWHRPPPVLLFERDDKAQLEIGFGADLWRWEDNMNFGPEAGNYKIIVDTTGIHVIREPLMTCVPVIPKQKNYRFTWYMAWRNRRNTFTNKRKSHPRYIAAEFEKDLKVKPCTLEQNGNSTILIDVAKIAWPSSCLRWAPGRNVAGPHPEFMNRPCWASNATQKRMRSCIRQIRENCAPGAICFRNLHPGLCWHPDHVSPRGRTTAPHWDMAGLLDFAGWVRQQLGDRWYIWVEHDDAYSRLLPSLDGLFLPNGFTN